MLELHLFYRVNVCLAVANIHFKYQIRMGKGLGRQNNFRQNECDDSKKGIPLNFLEFLEPMTP